MSSDFYTSSILPYAPIIIKICRAYTNTQEDFQDYYEEVCLQIWRSKDKFGQHSDWTNWIYKISLNVCLTLLKKRKSNLQYCFSNNLPVKVSEESSPFADESLNQLYNVIKQLSEVDRGMMLLYLEDKSNQEIADIMGINASKIGARIKSIKQGHTRQLASIMFTDIVGYTAIMGKDEAMAMALVRKNNNYSIGCFKQWNCRYETSILIFAIWNLGASRSLFVLFCDKYFGIDRAFGIDHFQPEVVGNIPFVKEGIFKYTNNGMYVYGFMLLWVPGLLALSKAALLVALFNHIYIWVHYYFTELPDIRTIYRSQV